MTLGFDQCVCVCLSPGVASVAVLDAQHHVGAGAAAGGLLEQAAALQRRRHAGQRRVAHAPRLAEAVHVPLPAAGRPVPHHLLWPGGKTLRSLFNTGFIVCYTCSGHYSPCAVTENVFAIEGVDRQVVLYSAVVKDGVPAVKQNLVLTKTTNSRAINRQIA